MSNLKRLCKEYFEAFSLKDLDILADMFADDVKLQDWEIKAEGKLAVLAANKKIFDSVDIIKVDLVFMYEEDDTVACQLRIFINISEIIEVCDIITFRDGKIIFVKAYKG